MMKRLAYLSFVLTGFLFFGCGHTDDDVKLVDHGKTDDNRHDATSDAASENEEGNSDDEPEDPKLGVISGPCGVLDDDEWLVSTPFIFRNNIDFGETGYDIDLLSEGAHYIAISDNAGGSSVASEAISFEMLNRCEQADLVKIETEIDYQDIPGKMTDILVQIDGRRVGVSVTRAVSPGSCNHDGVTNLLNRKLGDLPLSQARAEEWDAWERSILYIMAEDEDCADVVETVFAEIAPEIKGDAIVMITVSDGDDYFIYHSN